jgi:hypothetical protein
MRKKGRRPSRGPPNTIEVDLCRRYANRTDLLGPLVSVLEKIKHAGTPAIGCNNPITSTPGRVAKRNWRVRDRLSETQLDELVEAYQSGTTICELAERFGLGTTTVKRALKDREATRATSVTRGVRSIKTRADEADTPT